MKRPPVTSTTRDFLDRNRTAVESAHRLSLSQSQLARFLGWMMIALVLWSAGLIHMVEPRLFVFFIFVIPGILVINGSAGGLRFATAALLATALIWFLWLRPALAGTHPVTIQGQWVSSGQRGFSLAVYPLLHLTACLIMAVICLVKSRIKFFTVPVVIFWGLLGLAIGIPWKVEADRSARVRRAYAGEIAATKAFLIEKRYQDTPGRYPIGSKHPQSDEIAPLFEKHPGISAVYTYQSTISGAVVLYSRRGQRQGTNFFRADDWVRMPSGAWLQLELAVYLSTVP